MVIFRYSILFLKFFLFSYHFDNTCLAYAFACRMVRVFVLKSQYVMHLMSNERETYKYNKCSWRNDRLYLELIRDGLK